MNWLNKNAHAIQAIGAFATILLAIAALIGVKFQIDASARLQQEQSARDIYRSYLAISIQNPAFADPDTCAILDSPKAPAYENYVEYILYTAEQAIEADADWSPIFEKTLADHSVYFCAQDDWSGYTDEVLNLISSTRSQHCATTTPCE